MYWQTLRNQSRNGRCNDAFLLKATEHMDFSSLADRLGVLDDGNVSGYRFPLPSESFVAGSRLMEEFAFDGTKVSMKLINIKKQQKILFIGIVYKAT